MPSILTESGFNKFYRKDAPIGDIRENPDLMDVIPYSETFQKLPENSVDLSKLNGDLSVSSLHVPDQTTADSMHVEMDGDTWWGVNVADWESDIENAPAYILKDGTAKFSSLTINNTGISMQIIYGDGFDGDANLDGTNSYSWASKSGSSYTLTQDVFLDNLILPNGSTLNGGGYRCFVKNTFSGSGTLQNLGIAGGNGGNATAPSPPSTGVGGAAGAASASAPGNSIPAGAASKVGVVGRNGSFGASAASAGNAGTAGGSTSKAINTISSNSGSAGGGGGQGAGPANYGSQSSGGAAGTTTSSILNRVRSFISAYILCDFNGGAVTNFNISSSSPSAGSGGKGYSDGGTYSGAGGGSGASGSGGGIIWLAARVITFTGTISVVGGNGGNGGNGSGASGTGGGGGGGGGGNGGQGGVIFLITSTTNTPYTTNVSGGTGGSGGSGGAGAGGGSEGQVGTSGQNGVSGLIIKLII